jgi:hypothetical protein
MKTSIKFATGLILAATALVASGSAAQAGEGAAAGSVGVKFTTVLTTITLVPAVPGVPGVSTGTAAVTITAPNVQSISSSVAVGKNGAAAIARTAATDTFTSAVGSGGVLAINNANDATAGYTLTAETTPGTAQVNVLTPNTAVNLGPTGISLP